MTFEFISLLPLGGGTPGGSAAPATGFASVAGAGTTGTNESAPVRLTHELAQKPSPMTDKSSATADKQVFSADAIAREMQAHMRTLAMPSVPGEGVKAAVSRAARRVGIPYGQARRLWYGEFQEIPAYLADRIRQRAALQQSGPDPEIQSEISELKSLVAKIWDRLNSEPA